MERPHGTRGRVTAPVGSTRRDGILLAAWLGSIAVIRAGTVEERDPYWQIRAGLESLAGAPLNRPDTWSWAPVDHDVTWTSPLWNTVLGLGYRTAGFGGFFVVSLLSILALLATVTLLARRLGARPLPTLAAVTPILLLGLPFLSPRATVPAQALALAAVLAADRWRDRAGGRSLATNALVAGSAALAVTTLGMWLHLSWLALAPATAVACAVLWWVTPGLDTARRSVLSVASAVGAGAGILLGPYGTDAPALSRAVQDACSGLITEWFGMFHPSMALRWAPVGCLAIAGCAATVVWLVRRRRTLADDPRTGLVLALLVFAVPAALGGFTAIRFIGIAAFSLAPLAALGVTHLADRAALRSAEEPPRGVFRSARVRFWSEGRRWRPVLVAVVVLLVPGTALLGAAVGRPLDDAAVLRTLPAGCRLISDPGTGGAAVLLRPDVPVWYDGRADYWGRERNELAAEVLASDDVSRSPFTEAGCVALRLEGTSAARLSAALDASGDWRPGARSGDVRAWVRAS